jgi:hypothetical protein
MNFKDFAQQQFNEWKISGKCSEAVKLNDKISSSISYFDVTNPAFFYGDMNSPLVLVHLNPKRDKEYKPTLHCNFNSFEDFWNDYSFFGKRKYSNIDSKKPPYKKFDLKQVRFLRPFNILPFNNDDTNKNLEIVIDKKLQIDLIPFGSSSFDYTLMIDHLQPYFDRLFELILSTERKYIIFCGTAFKNIKIPGLIKKKSHCFKLAKKDGNMTKNEFELINMEVEYKQKNIQFCIASHFAIQGIPMDKYGEKIAELYGVFS